MILGLQTSPRGCRYFEDDDVEAENEEIAAEDPDRDTAAQSFIPSC